MCQKSSINLLCSFPDIKKLEKKVADMGLYNFSRLRKRWKNNMPKIMSRHFSNYMGLGCGLSFIYETNTVIYKQTCNICGVWFHSIESLNYRSECCSCSQICCRFTYFKILTNHTCVHCRVFSNVRIQLSARWRYGKLSGVHHWTLALCATEIEGIVHCLRSLRYMPMACHIHGQAAGTRRHECHGRILKPCSRNNLTKLSSC